MRMLNAARRALAVAWLLGASAQAGTLVIESWRIDDRALWNTVLIPAFERSHPGIELKFAPSAPTAYDAGLAARLAAGTAGDLLSCRPFDASLALYRKGHLEKLDGKPGMQNFPPSALLAWRTDDGRDSYCMPIASVIHGYLYNKKIFRRLSLHPPKTEEEFFALLEKLSRSDVDVTLALGTADQWEASQILFSSVGPNFWGGEQGRRALITGQARFTDAPFVAAFEHMARLGKYLPRDASRLTYTQSQDLFAQGRAAIHPSGSWEISRFNQDSALELGVFAPPVRKTGSGCQIADHLDIGIGVNSRSRNKEDALKFLAWVGSQQFSDLYTNRATGFFSLSDHLIAVRDPIAKQMAAWRQTCASTIRVNTQVLNRGEPPMEEVLWAVSAQVLNGRMTPREAAARIQASVPQTVPAAISPILQERSP